VAAQGKDLKPKGLSWLRRHHRSIREWLILIVAVIAGVAGWQQIADERDARKDAEDEQARLERRAQADEIAVWQVKGGGGPNGMEVALSNESQQPVYQAVISRVAIEGSGAHTGRQIPEELSLDEQQAVLVIPPGESYLHFGPGFNGMGRVPGFEIAFKDQAGHYWLRYANGSLQEIDRWAIGYYGLDRPVLWR
jgi:hypothetical protein